VWGTATTGTGLTGTSSLASPESVKIAIYGEQ
jgi:hypothetical protein